MIAVLVMHFMYLYEPAELSTIYGKFDNGSL